MRHITLILFLFIGILYGAAQAGTVYIKNEKGSSRDENHVGFSHSNPWPIFFGGDVISFTAETHHDGCWGNQQVYVDIEKADIKDGADYASLPYATNSDSIKSYSKVASLVESSFSIDSDDKSLSYTIPIQYDHELNSDYPYSLHGSWYRVHAYIDRSGCHGDDAYRDFYVMAPIYANLSAPTWADGTHFTYGKDTDPINVFIEEGYIDSCEMSMRRSNGNISSYTKGTVDKNYCHGKIPLHWDILQNGEKVEATVWITSKEGQKISIPVGHFVVDRPATPPIILTQVFPGLTNLHSDYLIDGSVRITGQLMAIDSGKTPEGTKFRIAFAPGDEYSKNRDIKWDGMNFTITVPKDNLPSYTLSPEVEATAENGLSSQWRAAPFPFASLVELYLLDQSDYPANDNVSGKTGEMQIGVKLVIKHPIDQFYLDLQLPDEVTPGATKPSSQCITVNSEWNGQEDNMLAKLTNLTAQECIIHIPINVLKLPSGRIQATLRPRNGTPDQELNADIHLVQ